MRLSIKIVVFLVLFNAWGGMMVEFGIDDHLGINAETGNSEAITEAANVSQPESGGVVGGTLLGVYNAVKNTIQTIVLGMQPGAKLLLNILPPGPAEEFVMWMYSIGNIIVAVDIAAYLRGVDF
jgi:hypothetical protein